MYACGFLHPTLPPACSCKQMRKVLKSVLYVFGAAAEAALFPGQDEKRVGTVVNKASP